MEGLFSKIFFTKKADNYYMNNKKGFTLVEAVITIAVSMIVLSLIASVSYVTSKISASQKQSSDCISEYAQAKLQIENFASKFSSNDYIFSLDTTSSLNPETGAQDITKKITIKAISSNENIAMIEYKKFKIGFYELNLSNELELTHSVDVLSFKDIAFSFSSELNILRCEVSFFKLNNYVFLVNLGGAYIGN